MQLHEGETYSFSGCMHFGFVCNYMRGLGWAFHSTHLPRNRGCNCFRNNQLLQQNHTFTNNTDDHHQYDNTLQDIAMTSPEVEGTCQPWRPCAPEWVGHSCQSNCSSGALSGFCVGCLSLQLHHAHLPPLLPPQPFQESPAEQAELAPAVFC